MGLLNTLWDNTAGGLLWKPLKKATGLTDAQLALAGIGLATGGAALAGAGPMAGLLGGAEAAAPAAAAGSTSSAAGLLAADAPAVGAVAGGQTMTAAPVFEYSTAGSAPTMTQLAGANQSLPGAGFQLAKAGEYAKAGGSALQAGAAAKGLLGSPQRQPVAQAQARPLDMGGLLAANTQGQQLQEQDDLKRRQMQAQITQNILGGGGYGRTA